MNCRYSDLVAEREHPGARSSSACCCSRRCVLGDHFPQARGHHRARRRSREFENSFWSGGDLAALYRGIESRGGATGMSSIFEFGFREFARLRQGGIPRRAAARGRAPRDARRRSSRRSSGSRRASRTLATRRLDQPVRRPVRHRLGHHELVRRARQRAAGDTRDGGARHRRGAGRHCHRIVRRDSGRDRLQPVRRPGRAASRCVTTRSWKSSPRSCSATPAHGESRRSDGIGNQTSRGRRLMGEINVVPYIDVMLVLLIIFMITAPLLARASRSICRRRGAKPHDAGELKDVKPIILSHRHNGPALPQLQRTPG